jgi:S-DNA-T family DNA segregation ATPase FtsK/SpoIIIE
MTAAQKRRSSQRLKSQKSAKLASGKGGEFSWSQAWIRDSISLLLLAGGVLLLLSIGSFTYMRVSRAELNPHGNIMGPLGHAVATLLGGFLGLGAVLPVLGLVWLAFFRSGDSEERPRRYSPGVVILSSVALLASSTGLIAMFGDETLAGSVGSTVFRGLSRNFGAGGAFVVLTILAAVSVAILLQRSVGDVAHGIRIGGQWLLTWLCWRAPKAAAKAAVVGGKSAAQGLRVAGEATASLFVSTGPAPLPVSPGARPKIRKSPEGGTSSEVRVPFTVTAPAEVEPEVIPRPEPIIVKPRPPEASEIRTLRPPPDKKKPKQEKDTAPQAAPQFDEYVAPELALLAREDNTSFGEDDDELRQKAEQIETKLRDFNIAGRVTQVHPGPVITLFEFEPAAGVKVGRIAALQDDLAMSLKASSIRIIAPIPKRGTVGIEVPNKNRAIVRLRECLESNAFSSADSILSVPLGKDTYGDAVVVDIATMPHLLMAGATGTGKSVCINALLLSLLYRAHPSELGLILIDPKVLELSVYDGIPHLRVPVVTDPRQAKAVLAWAVKEMDRRYRYMQKFGVRNIDGYNRLVSGEGTPEADPAGVSPGSEQLELLSPETPPAQPELALDATEDSEQPEPVAPEQLKPLPKIVIVIDELADLMLTVGREVEELITRLAQKARAAGIHLIVATQRPSVDVITGLIKANFPARLSFRVSSRIDSRTILDSMGAEKLLGRGDMLFMLPGAVPLKRVHGAFVDDQEVQRVVASLKNHCTPQYDEAIIAACDKALAEESGAQGDGQGGPDGEGDEADPFYDKAVELVLEKGQASTSMIQRTFRIGYNRAARIIEMMEREGLVGKMDGVKPREILVPPVDRSVP